MFYKASQVSSVYNYEYINSHYSMINNSSLPPHVSWTGRNLSHSTFFYLYDIRGIFSNSHSVTHNRTHTHCLSHWCTPTILLTTPGLPLLALLLPYSCQPQAQEVRNYFWHKPPFPLNITNMKEKQDRTYDMMNSVFGELKIRFHYAYWLYLCPHYTLILEGRAPSVMLIVCWLAVQFTVLWCP